MALVIGVVACVEGMAVKGSRNRSACRPPPRWWNRSFLVIVLDGLFAIFFASIGM